MEEYDVLVIGSGSGARIASRAIRAGLRTALVEKGALGGTCVNTGCIPSKMLVSPADEIVRLASGSRLGIRAAVEALDFSLIMRRMRQKREQDQAFTRWWIESNRDLLVFYGSPGRFTGDMTFAVDSVEIHADRIFICTGARPRVPAVRGLDRVPFLTNESLLDLEEPPESLAIIGGGYIAVEYAHFFAAIGTRVTILQRNPRLVPEEEPLVSDLLLWKLRSRMTVLTGVEVTGVSEEAGDIRVDGKDRDTGQSRSVTASALLVATGRTSNADMLDLSRTGVRTGPGGYIEVNDFLETSRKGIWAIGDAIGRQMFRHAANLEVELAWHNATHPGDKRPMPFDAVPHAVYTYPPIASIGLTVEQAQDRFRDQPGRVLTGTAFYRDTARGIAIGEEEGFAMAVADGETGRILGFHIIGPEAPLLIQEISNLVMQGLPYSRLQGIHIHPSLSELVPAALRHLKKGEEGWRV